MKTRFLVQNVLEKWTPDLFKLLEGQQISWISINKKFEKKFNQREADFNKNGGELRVDANFYDIIYGVIKDEPQSMRFFIYICVVFRMLNENLLREEKIMISKTIKKLLNDFTRDYIHFLGELFLLNNEMATRLYRLKGVEAKMENGKEIDFKFLSIQNNEEILVEVVNVWLKPDKLNTHNDIREFLTKKFEEKINDQTKGKISDLNFLLLPVLWYYTSDDLFKVYDFYKNGSGINLKGILEPFSYCCWDGKTLDPFHRFTKISKLFDEATKEETNSFRKLASV